MVFYDSDPLPLTLPAACRPLSPAEADAVLGGADTATDDSGFTTVLSNIEKVSKVAASSPPPAMLQHIDLS